MASEAITKLRDHLSTVNDIQGALGLMGWDERTFMPTGGAEVRAERRATLGRMAHEMFVSSETETLLADAERESIGFDPDSDELALVKHTRRTLDRQTAITSELASEAIRASSLGYQTWISARANSDFQAFLPALNRIVDVNRRFVEAYRTVQPDAQEDYDLLLEDFEPGLTAEEITSVFDVIRDRAIPLVAMVRERAVDVDDGLVHGDFPIDRQRDLAMTVIKQCGFDDKHWRLDETHHPFASSIATTDIRITTRYIDNFFNSAFFGSLHEFGHGLYERQVSPSLERTPLARGASMAWHESQSRMWENLVGRSRSFWEWAIGPARDAFPDAFGNASPDDVYRAVNKLHPSLIRVEADELTYNLHIILRFEMEREILAGKIELDKLPQAWNQKMEEYLGVDVTDDADGVLQDVHWSSGLFGYFPTYALGNVLSLQLWQRITDEIPSLEESFAQGEFGELRTWLGENVHAHGSKYLPKDLMERVLGTRELNPGPLTNYLEAKVTDLYGA